MCIEKAIEALRAEQIMLGAGAGQAIGGGLARSGGQLGGVFRAVAARVVLHGWNPGFR